jgi:ABC-2 type transport system permease protein
VATIKMLVRNRQALFFTLFMPLFIMLIFGYIGFDKPSTVDVGLVTHEPSAATTQFIDQIRQFPNLELHEGTLSDERTQLDEGDRAVVLDVPQDITSAPITAYTNAGKAAESQTVLTILNQFISSATIEQSGVQPIATIDVQEINVNNLRYIDFLIPGLIALSVMQMSVFSVAFVFTQYKEKGVLKRLLATPMKPIQFVAANAITRLMVSVVQAFIFIVMGIILFKIHVIGSYALLLLAVVLGALMFLGLGFTVSGLAKTTDAVPVFANLIVFPMMFLGGTFFAVSNMPIWLQYIAKVLPLTFFSTAVREIMTKGSGLAVIWPDILGMVVWAAILIFLSTVTFRFQEKDSG